MATLDALAVKSLTTPMCKGFAAKKMNFAKYGFTVSLLLSENYFRV